MIGRQSIFNLKEAVMIVLANCCHKSQTGSPNNLRIQVLLNVVRDIKTWQEKFQNEHPARGDEPPSSDKKKVIINVPSKFDRYC